MPELNRVDRGRIVYNPRTKMKVGRSELVEARIAKLSTSEREIVAELDHPATEPPRIIKLDNEGVIERCEGRI